MAWMTWVKFLDNMVIMDVVVMCVCVSRLSCGMDDLGKVPK